LSESPSAWDTSLIDIVGKATHISVASSKI